MPIGFRCPSCRKKLSTAKRKAGSVVSCPGCHADVRVPTASALDPRVVELLSTAGTRSAPVPAPLPTESAPAERPRPKAPPPASLNDLPLFEREDFADLLGTGDSSPSDERPLPLPVERPAPAIPYDSFVISRGSALMVLAAVAVLLGLAFVAGYLVGGRG